MDDEVKWSTSDSSIASINSKGKVTALLLRKVYVYAEAVIRLQDVLWKWANRISTFSRMLPYMMRLLYGLLQGFECF